MPNQIILAWKVLVAGTTLSPAQAAAKLGAVPLYASAGADPVLGALLGLTVATDATTNDATSATRTLTLNMTAAVGAPTAPPPFPCHPDTAAPPALPFVLRKTVTLAGLFSPINGSAVVPTSANQISALIGGTSVVQFASQPGVYYGVAIVGATSITLSSPYTGQNRQKAGTTAVALVANPSTRPAFYSTSDLDTNGVATSPAIPAGSGARTLSLSYKDSTGAGPFTVAVPLTGRRPAAVTLAGGSIDIATITDLHIATTGAFANSVGQITLCDLSAPLPVIPSNATPDQFRGELTDQAQTLIDGALAYLPPSYFALSQQDSSAPMLAGDFFVTTGSKNVPTELDQTGALAPGSVLRFAIQPSMDTPQGKVLVTYTVNQVTPKLVTLTGPFLGLGPANIPVADAGTGTKGDKSTELQNAPTAAQAVPPAAAPPSNAQLGAALAQYVNPGNAVPPPNPPLQPTTMSPAPTLLSGMFTQTLQLALAVPVAPQAITFA